MNDYYVFSCIYLCNIFSWNQNIDWCFATHWRTSQLQLGQRSTLLDVTWKTGFSWDRLSGAPKSQLLWSLQAKISQKGWRRFFSSFFKYFLLCIFYLFKWNEEFLWSLDINLLLNVACQPFQGYIVRETKMQNNATKINIESLFSFRKWLVDKGNPLDKNHSSFSRHSSFAKSLGVSCWV